MNSGKKVAVHLKVTQAARHSLPHKLVVKIYVKLIVIIGRGVARNFFFLGGQLIILIY